MLHVDIPSDAQIAELSALRADMAVSIYLPTTPLTQDTQADRIALKNMAREALHQLEARHADKRRIAALSEQIDDVLDDDEFWRFQARSLALFATPDFHRTWRLPNHLTAQLEVSDRLHLKPLLRSRTFPHACHVLALAAGGVRLVAVSADLGAATLRVEGMPRDAASAVGQASINSRSASGRVHGSEGHKVRLAQYARAVERAVRHHLAGSHLPLVLAANEPLATIYRGLSTHPHLAAETLSGDIEQIPDAGLAEMARGVLDRIYAAELAAWRDLFAQRESQGRATTDIAQAARAASIGAVDSLLVDIDRTVTGTVDEDGAVTFAEAAGATSYGVVDEIAGRVLRAHGRVLAVRAEDIPGHGALAAILRWAV